MSPFIRVQGRAYPLPLRNVDTDLIIPAAHLKTIGRSGLGRHAFETLRQDASNVFDTPQFRGAPILIALDNFGCGSSREHAAWALVDLGVRAIIAPSFSDIFSGNAFKNGIVTVALDESAVETLLADAGEHEILVDLKRLEVSSTAGHYFAFAMDQFRRECLMGGRDEIALTLASEPAIRAYEARVGI
ncbi:MAG TPA: 3-isopropylmalate dehydratase small subunit [Sphingomicrobium sp.]|nr:3-isopropylmalate dehydratase small subunit [Sphingomicrobium sp.]